MLTSEIMICIMCVVSLLLLGWAMVLHIKVKALENQVKALKHYIQREKKVK